MDRHLLGYDVRLAAETYVAARWDDQARRVFLLRPEIAWPLSVDPMVWPSIFQYQDANVAARYLPLSGWIDAAPADFPHQVLDLWQDPDAMVVAYRSGAATSPIARDAVPVAIEVLTDPGAFAGGHWGPLFDSQAAARTAPDDWVLLGYDVADEGMISGLANCGYDDAAKPDVVRRVVADLNDAGLFDALDAAKAFRTEADARVPEHSPFHIFALYRRPEPL